MKITHVGVIGAGTMGHGIAQVSAQAGYEVVLSDVTLAAAETGKAKLQKNLEIGVEKGKVTAADKDAALARITCVQGLEAMAKCQLVIEAAPEKMALKQELFRALSTLCSPETILATNTSSLSLTEIAASAVRPERVVGLHFFNPVHLMKLLEVVRAHQTSDGTITVVQAWGASIKKELIVVKDSPGFASSRLGVALGLEAIRMVEEGVASAADIDRAMELGYGYPMGPLKLGDLVGLDVRLAIAEYLYAETGSPTFRPPQLLKKMVRAGKLGKKSGAGFYSY
ncbi:MAG: 3-hydroxyacyl-CoA dehydrogenase family protein [Myxococcaceae bacterium]